MTSLFFCPPLRPEPESPPTIVSCTVKRPVYIGKYTTSENVLTVNRNYMHVIYMCVYQNDSACCIHFAKFAISTESHLKKKSSYWSSCVTYIVCLLLYTLLCGACILNEQLTHIEPYTYDIMQN